MALPDPVQMAKEAVCYQHNVNGIGTPRGMDINFLNTEEVDVIHFAWVLGNWKAILGTAREDRKRIWEVIFKLSGENPPILIVHSYLRTHEMAYEVNE